MKFTLPDFLRSRLGREIAIALVIKLAVIAAIFYAFLDGRSAPTDFRHGHHRRCTGQRRRRPPIQYPHRRPVDHRRRIAADRHAPHPTSELS